MALYRRLEFVFDAGQGPKVLVFIDFSEHISFGIPKSYPFYNEIPNLPSSENYQRITIHNNGVVKTHFPFAQNFKAPWDGCYLPLAKWDKPWTMMEELYWGSREQSIWNYLTKPKTGSGTRRLDIVFRPGVEDTKIRFSVFPSLDIKMDIAKQVAPEIVVTSFCTWVLVDSWPIVLVSIGNVCSSQRIIQLKSVGRQYNASEVKCKTKGS